MMRCRCHRYVKPRRYRQVMNESEKKGVTAEPDDDLVWGAAGWELELVPIVAVETAALHGLGQGAGGDHVSASTSASAGIRPATADGGCLPGGEVLTLGP